jgi:hypothetical protein
MCNLTSIINVLTLVTVTTATVIDQIMTNLPAQCYQTEACCQVLCSLYRHYHEAASMILKNPSETNTVGLYSLLRNGKWADVFSETDVDKKWKNFYTIFNHYFSMACPLIRKKYHCHARDSVDK